MLKLENISTYQFIYYLALSTDPNKKRISDELFWSNISNYQELENFIKYRRGENVDYNYLENELERVKSELAKANEKGIEPKLYITSGYDNSAFDKTDKETKVDALILSNPLGSNAIRRMSPNLNISDIRTLLAHSTIEGENALTYLRKVGTSYTEKVYHALEFYDEQLSRQASDATSSNDNLFTLNYDQKMEELILGEEPIEVSLEYILDTANTMIWSQLTEPQKAKINSIIKKIKSGNFSDKRYLAILDVFTNYVTLEEAQKGLVRTKAINRFIVK